MNSRAKQGDQRTSARQTSGHHQPRQRATPRTASVESETSAEPPAGVDADDNQFVGSVARALSILDSFQPGEPPLGNAELAERTGLTRPTVSRLAYTLVRCGYLSFNPRFRVYQLGPMAIAFGARALKSIDVRVEARPLLQDLARSSGFNAGCCARDGNFMVYTDVFEGSGLVGIRIAVGTRLPIWSSSIGRAHFAAMEQPDREQLLVELKAGYAGDWKQAVRSLDQAVADFHEHGFCVSLGDWSKDIHGASAPIRLPAGAPAYVANIGGPAYLLPATKIMSDLGPRIAELARTVEKRMSSNESRK